MSDHGRDQIPAPPLSARGPRRIADVSTVELDDELVIYNGRTHEVHILDPVSAFIWEHCDGERSVDDLARLVLEASEGLEFELAVTTVRRVVERLELLRLVTGYS